MLTIPGAGGESLGMDRPLGAAAAERGAHSLFLLYELIPNDINNQSRKTKRSHRSSGSFKYEGIGEDARSISDSRLTTGASIL